MSIYYLGSAISSFTNIYEVLLLGAIGATGAMGAMGAAGATGAMGAMAQHRISIMTKVLLCTHEYILSRVSHEFIHQYL